MGKAVDHKSVREPDLNRVAKSLGGTDKPCTVELLALMDCMKVRMPSILIDSDMYFRQPLSFVRVQCLLSCACPGASERQLC